MRGRAEGQGGFLKRGTPASPPANEQAVTYVPLPWSHCNITPSRSYAASNFWVRTPTSLPIHCLPPFRLVSRRSGESRYYYHGSWVDMHDLYYVVEERRRELKKFKRRGRKFNPVECLVMAVSGQIPCRDRKCVISMRLRPGYSDFSVMKQHLEEESYGFISQMRPKTVLDAGELAVGLNTPSLGPSCTHRAFRANGHKMSHRTSDGAHLSHPAKEGPGCR